MAGAGAVAAVATPLVQGVTDPIGRITVSGTGEFVEVCDLVAIPEDGSPVQVAVVIDEPRDGWNRMPTSEVGSVWLARRVTTGSPGPEIWAWSTICPHLGCGIDWESSSKRFVCPCHDSYFSSDGRVDSGPSPRQMDRLQVRTAGGKVQVQFEKFVMGIGEQKPG